MQSIPKVKSCKDPQVIAKSMEKFIGFTIGRLQFMDSLQHLSSSLDKLVDNLADKAKIIGKKEYICHYKNLKFYLKNGLKLKKIHKILQFDQSQWLKPYIDLNTKLRQEADNKFEEGFAKLMNNSFFGK